MYKSLERIIRNSDYSEFVEKIKRIKNYNVLDNEGFSPLGISAYYGHLEACKYILDNGGNVNFKNKEAETPLHRAIKGRIDEYEEVIHLLIEKGTDINSVDADGNSILITAIRSLNSANFALSLIAKGADVNTKNKWKMTPLMYAAELINVEIVEKILEKVTDINQEDVLQRNALYYVVRSNLSYDVTDKKEAIKIIDLLLSKNSSLTTRNSEKEDNLLIASSIYGHNNIIEKCIEAGIDINAQDKNGDTALIIACRKRNAETVKLLLKHNANTTLENHNKKTAMWEAWNDSKKWGKSEIEEILIKNGVSSIKGLGDENIDETDKNGRTALMLVCEKGVPEKVAELLEKGADPNIQDKRGKTALMFACKSIPKKVELLLNNGASPNIQDNYGKTALYYLMDDDYYGDHDREIFDLLMNQKNIDVNLASKTGTTALMLACKLTLVDHYYIEKLIEKGADVSIKNNKEQDAISFVRENYDPVLKELLRKHL